MPKTLEELERETDDEFEEEALDDTTQDGDDDAQGEKDGTAAAAALEDLDIVIANSEEERAQLEGDGLDDDEPAPLAAETETGEDVDLDDKEQKELARHPLSVQKRIKREIRLRRTARDEATAAKAQATAAEARERAAMEKTRELQLAKLESDKALVSTLLSTTESQIAALTDSVVKAKEAGESKNEVELQGKLDDARARKREIEAAGERLKTTVIPPLPDPKPKSDITPSAQAWVARNKWMGNPEFAPQEAAVRAIDAQMLKSGKYDPNTDAYFEELDRRIAREIPTLKPKAAKAGLIDAPAKPAARTVAKRPPTGGGVAAVARGASRQITQSKTRVVLGPADFEEMRKWGKDPTNKEDLTYWAKTKLEAAHG